MASEVPRDPSITQETRRFLDGLARRSSLFNGVTTAAAATALLNVFTSALKGLVPASGGGTTTFLRADAAFTAPIIAGMIRQVLQNTYATNTDLTTTIPLDDTTPTSSEGTEVLSQAITPNDASNKVLARAVIYGAVNTNSVACIVAIFRGTTCIQAVHHTFTTSNFPATIVAEILDSPASASAQTYSVRVGPSSNTLRLNGTPGAGRFFGGAATCTLTLMEIEA